MTGYVAHDEKVKKVNDSIERLQKAQAELAKQINAKSTGKEEGKMLSHCKMCKIRHRFSFQLRAVQPT